ncbi:MAG: DUF58 domain-containing protein [Chloroflexi bacterium]|nr:DUF58 domain-containing protein [Chloroflexota bacterium]
MRRYATWIRRLPIRLLLVLALVGVSGLAALTNGFDLFFRLTYTLVLVLAASFLWSRLSVMGLQAQVEGGMARSQVGQTISERITVSNLVPLPKFFLEVQQLSDLPSRQTGRVVNLAARGSQSWYNDIVCWQRGRYTLGPIRVVSGDPFGLFLREVLVGTTHTLVVYPATVPLPRFNMSPAELPGEGRHRRRTQFLTPNAAGIRQYVHGDSFNRIHWPSTARTGDLMVKEFELDPASDFWVILDLDRRVQAGHGQESTEEYGVTIAASIMQHYLELNRAVGLVAYGREYLALKPDRGGQQLVQALELLAVASAQGTTSLAELLASEGKRFGRYTTAIIVTASTEEHWVYEIQHVLRRGAQVAVVLLEPGTFGGRNHTLMTVSSLLAFGVPTYLVKQGERLEHALSVQGQQAARASAGSHGG